MAPYRPPGRSNRSGRSNADNDVFEGLPVKQWSQAHARVSLAPPAVEAPKREDDKWADPPMPRDYQLLNPWTQQLLRLARSGKVGTKRKQDPDSQDEEKPDEEAAEESKENLDDRGYVTKKWKPVPENQLEPEHKHFEFLAKRRRGLSNLYGSNHQSDGIVPMRKTKVQKTDANGEITVYEALIPEGQTVEGEVTTLTDLADVKPVLAAPGTVIEGVGIANEDGVFVAEHLKQAAPRRNRPPPKKKGGPGRGKKRVTFTNPDGSTYTTIVPNATKIVPQPGQTVKHVAKGEEATADVTAEEAAAAAAAVAHVRDGDDESGSEEGDDDDDGGDDDDDGDDEDDGREEGELSEEDAPTDGVTPAPTLPDKSETETTGVTPAPTIHEKSETETAGVPPTPSFPTESETLAGDAMEDVQSTGTLYQSEPPDVKETSITSIETQVQKPEDVIEGPPEVVESADFEMDDSEKADPGLTEPEIASSSGPPTNQHDTKSIVDALSAPLETATTSDDLVAPSIAPVNPAEPAAAPEGTAAEPNLESSNVHSLEQPVEPEPTLSTSAVPDSTVTADPMLEPASTLELTSEVLTEPIPEPASEPIVEPTTSLQSDPEPQIETDAEQPVSQPLAGSAETAEETDEDLLGNLEKHLGGDSAS